MVNLISKPAFTAKICQTLRYLLLAYLCIVSSPVQADSNSICIQTFNAYGPAYSRDLGIRTAVMGDELEASPCDIVQMQEVWSETHHHGVMTALGPSMFSLSSVRFDDVQRPVIGQSGLATFTTEILSGQRFEAFHVNTDGLLDNVREFLGVIKGIGSSLITIRQNEDHKIQLMNVHLHPTSQRVRIAQIVQIMDSFYKNYPFQNPLIITGDFNFKPTSEEYDLLQSVIQLTDAYVTNNGPYDIETCTYCESNIHHWPGQSGVLDYIWSRRGQQQTVIHSQTSINLYGLNGVTPSDHFGLRSHLQLHESTLELIDSTTFTIRQQRALKATNAALRALDIQGASYEPFYSTRRFLKRLAERLDQSMNSPDPVIFNLRIK